MCSQNIKDKTGEWLRKRVYFLPTLQDISVLMGFPFDGEGLEYDLKKTVDLFTLTRKYILKSNGQMGWLKHKHLSPSYYCSRNLLLYQNINPCTVFPHIVAVATILFWKLECGNYSKEETIQGRKLLIHWFLVCTNNTYPYISIYIALSHAI